jgi:MoaA/NifB/PqqE/SkfB family radical SAM enzyme
MKYYCQENKQSIYKLESIDGNFFITRTVKNTGLKTKFGYYMQIDDRGDAVIKKITPQMGKIIIKEALPNDDLSSALIFIKGNKKIKIDFKKKGESERLYTSTGEKFLFHKDAITSFKRGDGKTVISTHISPEGTCTLKCPYCSVGYRSVFNRLKLGTIKKYINILKKRGLKAVILTGGGEPALYPQINELIEFIHDKSGLELAMISNGTILNRIKPSNRRKLEWLRISVNVFDGWENKIYIPPEFINSDAVIGFSFVFTPEHNFSGDNINLKDILARIIRLMDKFDVQYLRILPNCLVEGQKFNYMHLAIDKLISFFNDKRIFHQLKTHCMPDYDICYQSYFRPYLSEEKNPINGKPGTVFPCDSLVLNDSVKKFAEKYALCEPERIGDYLDGKIKSKFNPKVDCSGCVFADNNKLLFELINSRQKSKYKQYSNKKILHKNFV